MWLCLPQTTMDFLLQNAGLRGYLQNTTGGNFTLFAPSDAAWAASIAKASLTCTYDFYVTTDCDTLQDLATATNLQQTLLDHGAHPSHALRPQCSASNA
jgi:hypothetical protein